MSQMMPSNSLYHVAKNHVHNFSNSNDMQKSITFEVCNYVPLVSKITVKKWLYSRLSII